MRKVLKNIQEVAHYWANQVQTEGKASSLFFEGNTIYSYGSHFPIATIYPGKVLFTVRDYSNTTAKHKAVVRAANWREVIYCFNPYESANGNHSGSFDYWVREAGEIIEKLSVARKPEKYMDQLSQVKAQIDKYCQHFEISIPSNLCEVLARVDSSAKMEAIKEKVRERAAANLEARKERERIKREQFLADLNKWQTFETSRLYRKNGHDYLRYNKEKERVETTQGVEIPKQIARILWDKVKTDSLQVGDQVLHYTVRSVGKTIEIGCHTFPKSYLVEFGEGIF